ncbi:MAG: PQQ-binding-like beta-propeller repeat protein [Sandaracinaceae bacterium]|nr:PQQ-binding-like beta-propeller repeat protein [Sandaracinaceae bacterium]
MRIARALLLSSLAVLGCGTAQATPRAAPAAERAEDADDGTIPVVWRVERAGALALRLDGPLVLADDGAEVVLLDAASGAVRARATPPPRANGFDDQPRASLLAGRLVAEAEPGALVVCDAAGAEAWRVRCLGPSFDACRVRAVATAGALVVATGRTLALVAHDITSGAERWRHEPDSGLSWSHGALAADGARVYASSYGTHALVALDAQTGALVWQAECDAAYGPGMGRGPGDCMGLSSDGRRVAAIAVSGSEVLVLDAATGASEQHLFGRDLGFATLVAVLAGDALVLGGLASAEAGAVAVVDLATGAVRWTIRTPEPVRSVVARGDVVWARGIYGTLWRLDARDGAVSARWGLRGGGQVHADADRLVLDDGAHAIMIDPAGRRARTRRSASPASPRSRPRTARARPGSACASATRS